MRYFVRMYNASGHVDELEQWNGPYGFGNRADAKEDILEFIGDAEDAYHEGLLDTKYNVKDFFVEEVDLFLPDGSAD